MEDKRNMEQVRQKLEERRASLRKCIEDELARRGRMQTANPDRADLADAYISRQRRTALLATYEEQLELVESALKRLDEGTYGLCTRCSKPISTERLQVLPEASLCMECQKRSESNW